MRRGQKLTDAARRLNARIKSAAWRRKNPDAVKAIDKRWRQKHPEKVHLKLIRQRARCKGIPFNLTIEDVTVPNYCPVLGLRIKRGSKVRGNCPSVDRINPRKGYVKGNVIVVSMLANMIKTSATVEQIGKVYRFYRRLCR